MTTQRLDAQTLERCRALSTSSLSDALDRHGLPGAVEGLRPLLPEACIAGQAYTLAYMPVSAEGGTVGDFLDDLGVGDVVVIDNRGRTDCTVWGNIMTEVAKRNGVEGTVVDGVNRDLQESLALSYPIWSRQGHMRTGKDRVMLQAVNVPVCLGTVRVEPGDLVCADGNGVVVIPLGHHEDVLATAEGIEHTEDKILKDIRSGMALGEARSQHGYHGLQTRGAS